MRLARLLLVYFVLTSSFLFAQERLSIPFSHYHLYSGSSLPAVLNEFPGSEIDNFIVEIMEAVELPLNFSVYAANVPSVAVVRNGSQYSLLYNRQFLLDQPRPIFAKAMLAHEIGHIVNQHQLRVRESMRQPYTSIPARDRARIEAEELAADEFAGYALYLIGAPDGFLERMAEWLPADSALSPNERTDALKRGEARGDALLILSPGSNFNDDGSGSAIVGMPEFPFPPPEASCRFELSSFFKGRSSLGQVADKIKGALDRGGYFEHQYYYVPGGFAMATRMEQFNQDGSCKSEPGRWSATPVRDENFEWLDYLKALFTADPGYFRVFVFIVSDQLWVVDRNRKITSETASAWLSGGTHLLPAVIRQKAITSDLRVSVLIYEFEVSEATHERSFSNPSRLSPQTHMQKSQLLYLLR